MTTTANTQIMLSGFQIPEIIRTAFSFVGLLAAIFVLGLAIAATAVILPIALLVTTIIGRPPQSKRQGWQPVLA